MYVSDCKKSAGSRGDLGTDLSKTNFKVLLLSFLAEVLQDHF